MPLDSFLIQILATLERSSGVEHQQVDAALLRAAAQERGVQLDVDSEHAQRMIARVNTPDGLHSLLYEFDKYVPTAVRLVPRAAEPDFKRERKALPVVSIALLRSFRVEARTIGGQNLVIFDVGFTSALTRLNSVHLQLCQLLSRGVSNERSAEEVNALTNRVNALIAEYFEVVQSTQQPERYYQVIDTTENSDPYTMMQTLFIVLHECAHILAGDGLFERLANKMLQYRMFKTGEAAISANLLNEGHADMQAWHWLRKLKCSDVFGDVVTAPSIAEVYDTIVVMALHSLFVAFSALEFIGVKSPRYLPGSERFEFLRFFIERDASTKVHLESLSIVLDVVMGMLGKVDPDDSEMRKKMRRNSGLASA